MTDAFNYRHLLATVADDEPVDWAAVEALATKDRQRRLLADVRLAAAVVHLYRSDRFIPIVRRAPLGEVLAWPGRA